MTKIVIVLLAALAYAGPQGSRIAVTLQALHSGASPAVVGILNALSFIFPMLVSIPAGRIVDRAGVRAPVYVCSALMIAALALAFALPSLWTLGLCAAAAGTCYIGYTVALNVGVMRIGTPQERISNFAWLTVGISAGFGLGPIAAGFGFDALGGRGVFLLLAGFPLLLCFLMLWQGRILPDAVAHAARSSVRLIDAVSDRGFRPILLVSLINPTLTDIFSFVVPVIAARAGLSASVVGTILGCYAGASFLARVATPLIVNRVRHWVVVANLYVIAGIGLLLFGLVSDPALYIALAIGIGMSHGMGQPLVMAAFVTNSPPGRQGEILGVQNVLQGGTSALAPVVIGVVGTAVGMAPVLWAVGAALLGASWYARRIQTR